jgi:hypothetical protein
MREIHLPLVRFLSSHSQTTPTPQHRWRRALMFRRSRAMLFRALSATSRSTMLVLWGIVRSR